MKLVLATNNPGKVKEFARILEPLGIEVITQKQAGADLHVEENGETFAENARLKAMAVYRATGLPTVADDSGLCVDVLDGKPGVYSARWYGEDTPYTEKNARLIAELEADIVTVDGLIAFAGSEAGEKVFGTEKAKEVAAHAEEIKAAGAKYCDCPACAAVEAILEKKDQIL